ncbi:c-type cytochrome [Gluconacetobacter entanii]|uniref:C-type cytochrome n=1 Tax=Gluconacetobacter entanii TaxID=108528 RepID=A0A318QE16_9PROT|nr:c-type cytochrome [Gluconacetobacter entanii]MBE7619223.1 c-type cytochrome [Komagataeibacter sp. FXV2]MCE2577677.1 c-type cytochrome [Komagataeibacter sp. FNDCR1]MBY4639881.1 c-type cytochrome [Gluconacetobacter entanii]MCW4581096.1 c-type cytochrome [Gluconacetobacter entanii]MCW4584356.1 c-type cytochrome [Gluconacetobacter entanii]
MNSMRLNQMGAAFLIAAVALGGSWGMGSLLVPHRAAAQSAVPMPQSTPDDGQDPPIETLLAHADAAKGHEIADHQCGMCHSFAPHGPSVIGPDLFGVMGTHIGDIPDYEFSDALSAHKKDVWTPALLSEWIKKPDAFAPGTKMAFPGIASATDRANLVAFIQTLVEEKN